MHEYTSRQLTVLLRLLDAGDLVRLRSALVLAIEREEEAYDRWAREVRTAFFDWFSIVKERQPAPPPTGATEEGRNE